LLRKLVKHVIDLAGGAREDSEFLGLDEEIVLGAFSDEALEELATLFDKAFILVTNKLLLGDGGNVAAGPSFVKGVVKSKELVVAALNFEAAFTVLPCHGVLNDGADLEASVVRHLDGVSDGELGVLGILFEALGVGRATSFGSSVESHNLLHEVLSYTISSLLNFKVGYVVGA
jgi:hypothetical protein